MKKVGTKYLRESVSRTGFIVSLVSYVGFWLMDVIRPGFVARYFSVHIFLIAVIVFGVWWSYEVEEYTDRPALQLSIMVLFAFLLSVLTWVFGEGFDMFRPIAVIIAFLTPFILLKLIRLK